MIFEPTISNEEVGKMTATHFPGKIVVVDDTSQIEAAINVLRQSKIIGFDTETRPSFKKGRINTIALIQLSTENICYLFRVFMLKDISLIVALLEDESITKIGISIKDDFHSLNKITQCDHKNFVELQSFCPQYGIEEKSLRKIYALVFGEKVSKSQRLSNWESDQLTPAQQMYAATDAWACLNLYNYLISK